MRKTVTWGVSEQRNNIRDEITSRSENLTRMVTGPAGEVPEPVPCKPCCGGLITEPCVGEGSCEETFTRSESGTLGTSEFGEDWQHDLLTADPVQIEVDGAKAIFSAADGDTGQSWEWVDVWAGATLPVEVLWTDVRFRWTDDTDNTTMILAMDSEPDPQASEFFCWLGFDVSGDQLDSALTTSEGGDSTTIGTFAGQDVLLNCRIRLETGAVRARIWETVDVEPGTWTIEDAVSDESPIDGQLVSIGGFIGGVSNLGGGNESFIEWGAIEITEGCTPAGGECEQEIFSADGAFLGTVGAEESVSDIVTPGLVILGKCARQSGSVYTSPSPAERIVTTYIDGLPTLDYTFDDPMTLTFDVGISEDSEVWARYVSV